MNAGGGYIGVDADGSTSARMPSRIRADKVLRPHGRASIAFIFFFYTQIQGRSETLCVKKHNKRRTFVLHLIDIINVILEVQINLQKK
jgi:hypothetical protein